MDVSLKQLEEAVSLKRQINELQNRLNSILGRSGAPSIAAGAVIASALRARRGGRKRRGGLSPAGRARIAAAARARWARVKAAGGGGGVSVRKVTVRKRAGRKGGITPAGRRKLSQMMKARWAARRKG